MAKARRAFTAEFKSQVVLELITGKKTVAQLLREYSIKDNLIVRRGTRYTSLFVKSLTGQWHVLMTRWRA